MAIFLTTSGITHQLEAIIKGAEGGRLLLISPYLKFNRRIKDLLEDQVQRAKTNIYVVYGKTELRSDETEWLADNYIRTVFREHLHAKCYMNDSHALITSMNLYEFSQQNNDEMGILVSAEEDPELYKEIRDEAELLLRRSENVKLTVTRVKETGEEQGRATRRRPLRTSERRPADSPASRSQDTKSGCCLRCGNAVPFNPKRPYCNSDYTSWTRYKNNEYSEKYCHGCGKSHSTSMAKPLCTSCYRKSRAA